jgi:hypothetical protein
MYTSVVALLCDVACCCVLLRVVVCRYVGLHLCINLGAGPLALTVAEIGDFSRSYGTYIGDLTVGDTLHCTNTVLILLYIIKMQKGTAIRLVKG